MYSTYQQSPGGLWAPTANFQANDEKNMLVVYLPQPTMRISQQALRGHTYNMNDRLVNDIVNVATSNAAGGVASRTDQIVGGKNARDAITLGTDPDAVFDVNQFNTFHRFVLTLNRFPTMNNIGGNKYTVVVTGVFREEPFNPGTKTINEHALMEIHSRQVITRSRAIGPSGGGPTRISTSADQIFFNPADAQGSNINNVRLAQNTPGAFDFSNPQYGTMPGQKPTFHSPAMYDVSEAGKFSSSPMALSRFQHVPKHVLRNLVEAVSNDVAEQQSKMLNASFGVQSLDGNADFPETHLGSISQHLRDRENSSHLPIHLGPEPNTITSMENLKNQWGVDELIPIKLQDGTLFSAEDQTARGSRAVYCSLISALLPSFASNLQLSDVTFKIYSVPMGFGQTDHRVEWSHIWSTIDAVNQNQEELARRASSLYTELKASVMDQLFEMAGDYVLQVEFHLYGKSHMSLQLMDEAGTGGNVWEFMPNHTTFTTPLLGSDNRVLQNQNTFGQMVYDITSAAGKSHLDIGGGDFNAPTSPQSFNSFDPFAPQQPPAPGGNTGVMYDVNGNPLNQGFPPSQAPQGNPAPAGHFGSNPFNPK